MFLALASFATWAVQGALNAGNSAKQAAADAAVEGTRPITETVDNAVDEFNGTVRTFALVVGGLLALVILMPFLLGLLPTYLFSRGGPKTIKAVYGGVSGLFGQLIEGIIRPVLALVVIPLRLLGLVR
jgi:hypothetical protein